MRTALAVARTGTVRAAASELGVHRATVHRHIELLEGELGTKLFLRHARGYVLTDDGSTVLDVASRADEMFLDLEGGLRNRSAKFSGELILAIFHGLGSMLMPAIKKMKELHPDVGIELVADETISRLEYGEAHIAFRAGPKPDALDYVVRPFLYLRFGLYCSRAYLSQYGRPDLGDFTGHKFVGPVGGQLKRPYSKWLEDNVEPGSFALNTSSRVCIHQAIASGIGMGFMAEFEAKDNTDLVAIVPPSDEICLQVWSVTHMDLHRTDKIQEFLRLVNSTTSDRERVPEPRTLTRASVSRKLPQ
ncbi:MAG: LysR family transcriptional regulator [Pseudomonadota bacterium]